MKTIFVKVNDRYVSKYSLTTSIVEMDGKKYAIKNADTRKASDHLLGMAKAFDSFNGQYGAIKMCPVLIKDNGLVFDYIEGKSGMELLQEAAKRSDKSQYLKLITQMLDCLPQEDCAFESTVEFNALFGELDGLTGVRAYSKTIFDFTAGNIIFSDDGPILIDYEWFFDFPVPVDLIRIHFIESIYLNLNF